MIIKTAISATLAALLSGTCLAQADCQSIADDVEQANKALAQVFSEGIGDNSAPRETNRQLKELNIRVRQQTLVSLGIAAECDPSMFRPGDFGPYVSPALECATERLKGNYEAAVCSLENWSREEEE